MIVQVHRPQPRIARLGKSIINLVAALRNRDRRLATTIRQEIDRQYGLKLLAGMDYWKQKRSRHEGR